MISSADDSLLILNKWHEEAAPLLVYVGSNSGGGVTFRASIASVSPARVDLTGDSNTKAVVLLTGASYEFLHPTEIPRLQHLTGQIKRHDSCLTVHCAGGLVVSFTPLMPKATENA